MRNSVNDKNNFFSYGYEKIGDTWELKYNEFIIQIVQTTDNFKALSDFRNLINDAKSTFFIMLFSLIVAILLLTILAANKFGKKHIEDKIKVVCTIMFLVFSISFGISSVELFGDIRDVEYLFFKFPESPSYPK